MVYSGLETKVGVLEEITTNYKKIWYDNIFEKPQKSFMLKRSTTLFFIRLFL
jgi:hypothetical protein